MLFSAGMVRSSYRGVEDLLASYSKSPIWVTLQWSRDETEVMMNFTDTLGTPNWNDGQPTQNVRVLNWDHDEHPLLGVICCVSFQVAAGDIQVRDSKLSSFCNDKYAQ